MKYFGSFWIDGVSHYFRKSNTCNVRLLLYWIWRNHHLTLWKPFFQNWMLSCPLCCLTKWLPQRIHSCKKIPLKSSEVFKNYLRWKIIFRHRNWWFFFFNKRERNAFQSQLRFCFPWTRKPQNLWRHHEYYYILENTFLIVSVESFVLSRWNLVKC